MSLFVSKLDFAPTANASVHAHIPCWVLKATLFASPKKVQCNTQVETHAELDWPEILIKVEVWLDKNTPLVAWIYDLGFWWFDLLAGGETGG